MTTTKAEILSIAHAAFQDFSHGLETGDWTLFLSRLSSDFSFWFPAGPFRGTNSGKQRAEEFFTMVSNRFPEGLTLSVEKVLCHECTVLFEVRSRGKMLDCPYENQAAISFDVAADKNQICGYREYLGVIFKPE